jgi:hypothetical protein
MQAGKAHTPDSIKPLAPHDRQDRVQHAHGQTAVAQTMMGTRIDHTNLFCSYQSRPLVGRTLRPFCCLDHAVGLEERLHDLPHLNENASGFPTLEDMGRAC